MNLITDLNLQYSLTKLTKVNHIMMSMELLLNLGRLLNIYTYSLDQYERKKLILRKINIYKNKLEFRFHNLYFILTD